MGWTLLPRRVIEARAWVRCGRGDYDTVERGRGRKGKSSPSPHVGGCASEGGMEQRCTQRKGREGEGGTPASSSGARDVRRGLRGVWGEPIRVMKATDGGGDTNHKVGGAKRRVTND